jgi:hypothetical protein
MCFIFCDLIALCKHLPFFIDRNSKAAPGADAFGVAEGAIQTYASAGLAHAETKQATNEKSRS